MRWIPRLLSMGDSKTERPSTQQVKLLWLGMGTEEPDFFHGSIGAFRTMLDKAGIKYVYFSSPGTAHEWLTWRSDLNDFAPRLFQAAGK